MKKTLFFIMAVALCTSLMAQDFRKPIDVKHQPTPILKGTEIGAGSYDPVTTIPTQRSGIVKNNPGYYLEWIGLTHYNLPTNTNSRNTVSFRPDSQDAAIVWTTALEESDTRGTGINYYNIADRTWGDLLPADIRIESERTGWGTHGFTTQGEVIVAHNSQAETEMGLLIATRDNWGVGEWKESTLKCSPYTMSYNAAGTQLYQSTGLVWPTMITNGNTVHVIAVTEQYPSGATDPCAERPYGYEVGGKLYATVPLYYRSSDGGKTWDINEHNFHAEGMTADELAEIRGDTYILSARDNHVVFLYKTDGAVFYMESRDNGDNWVRKEVYNDEKFLGSPSADLPARLVPRTSAAYIDENHTVHVVFNGYIGMKQAGDCGLWGWSGVPGGLVYWNDTYDPINWEDLAANDEGGSMYMYDTLHAFRKYPRYIRNPSILGFPDFYVWTGGPSWSTNQFRNNGWAPYPRIVVQDGKVFISYQSPLDYPLSVGNYFYRGIFVTVSDDGGVTWDVEKNTSWLSYNPELFQVEWDNWEEPEYDPIDDVWYWDPSSIRITTRTDNAYPGMSSNIKDWQVLFQWYHQELPFTDDAVFTFDPALVYAFHHPLWKFPGFNNLQDIREGKCNKIVETKPVINATIFPNPAVDGIVNVKVDTHAPYTLTVTNIMGQVVHTMKAQNEVKLNVSNYVPGIYIVNVRTANAVTSQKLIVK